MSLPDSSEQPALKKLLQELMLAVEELLLTGLIAATDKTKHSLAVSFQNASKHKLLRLGSTLRIAVEEIGRYTKNDESFSRRRFSFFLNRAWMLAKGMLNALEEKDEQRWRQLTWRGGGTKVDALQLVTMGVLKKVVPNAFVAFEFRLRAVTDHPQANIEKGQSLTWSNVYPIQPNADIPAEAYLHLPLPQKFKATEFLKGHAFQLGPLGLSDEGRISLLPDTQLQVDAKPFSAWADFLHWDSAASKQRLDEYQPGPFDLDVEMQEEIVVENWRVGEAEELTREQLQLFPIITDAATYYCALGSGPENDFFRDSLLKLNKKKLKAPMFGVMHYESCRLMFQPLSLIKEDGPEQLMLSKETFDQAALVRALKFT